MKEQLLEFLTRARFGLLMVFSIMAISELSAQSRTISGTVADKKANEPLPGVTVLVKGTNSGAATDLDGNYTVSIPADLENPILVYSFIGFATVEEVVGSRTTINVNLEIDLKSLDEVIVVGYGTQKKSLLTGSISKIDEDILESVKTVRVEQALQGAAPGVMVMSNSGQPGDGWTVNIRGFGTPGGAEPLYIIDGLPVGGSALDILNPNDIQSMEVLKDAAAAAIYGARGSNGVVIITTKTGKKNSKPVITYQGFYGVQNPWHRQDVLNSDEYVRIINEAYVNDSKSPFFDGNEVLPNTDWQDAMYYKNAPKQSHHVGITGGSELGSFSSSLSYFEQDGIIAKGKSNFERVNLRINGTRKVQRLQLGANINVAHIKTKGIDTNSQYGGGINQAINMPPIIPVNNEDGSWGIPEDVGLSMQEIVNPVALLSYVNSESGTFKGIGGVNASLEILDGLVFKTAYSGEVAEVKNRSFTPVYRINATNKNEINSVSQSSDLYVKANWENTLTYKKSFGSNNLTFLVGSTRFREYSESLWGSKDSLIFETFDKAYINNSLQVQGDVAGSFWEHTLQSFFGRIHYDYDEKYLAEVVLRRDGSSRFGKNNRYGYFPAVSVGWVFTEEDFIPNVSFLDFGKIRASWGQNGNENIGDFKFTSLISQGHYYNFGTDQTLYNGIQPAFIANPDLRWEASEQLDIGLDLSLFAGKVSATFDYYQKTNKDWLLSGTGNYPRVLGNLVAEINAGAVKNTGYEFELNYQENFSKDLKVNVGFTASTNKNEVTEIIEGTDHLLGATGGHGQGTIVRGTVGMPLGYFWGYKTAGIFNHPAELGKATHQPSAQLGDLIFVDTNEDGTLDDLDKQKIGTPYPKLMMGLNLSFDYKNFDLSMFWYSAVGHQIWNATRRADLIVSNYPTTVLDRWTENNTNTDVPRVTSSDLNRSWRNPSDFYLEDADYLRLKNITLGYTLPTNLTGKLKISIVRFYVTSENLLTLTKYSGMEVEVGGGALGMGIDYGVYPQAKTFVTGVNITF
ncbi:MAG: TonB-dependent receptor [Cyclobacteriaceae bacterium]